MSALRGAITAILLGMLGCGGDRIERTGGGDEECDRYDVCDQTGPFGDSDYGEYGEDDGQPPPDQGKPPDGAPASRRRSAGVPPAVTQESR